jgi:hypothetical protein
MSFLPVAERELRVSARKRGTYWLRLAAGLAAAALLFLFYLAAWLMPGGAGPRGRMGPALFQVLMWLSLAAGLSMGLFLTSDCLSEEKRESTIGLLFLTDLRGYDIVLGKLLATSLRAFYAMLAVFPVVGIAFVMGGVTGIQFWRASLAVVNAIGASLTVGLFVSAISRQSQKALLGTLVVLALWIGLGPAIGAAGAVSPRAGWLIGVLALTSPGYLLYAASAWGRTPFWWGLLVNQGVAWLFLAAGCLLLPRAWQEKASQPALNSSTWRYAWRFGKAPRRQRLRQRLLGENPIAWLLARERWQTALVWGSAVLLVGGLGLLVVDQRYPILATAWNSCSSLVLLLFYLGAAAYAVRFGLEARRNGMLELLLVTPLTVKQIVQGQWRAAGRLFSLPLAVCLLAQAGGAYLAQEIQWRRLSALSTASPMATPGAAPQGPITGRTATKSGTNVIVTFPAAPPPNSGAVNFSVAATNFSPPRRLFLLAGSLCASLIFLANLIALVWFGMWMALNSKTPNQATLKTLLFVQVIPWFVVTFVSTITVSVFMIPMMIKTTKTGAAPGFQLMSWFPFLIAGVALALSLGKDVAFSIWARRKLYSSFRERALGAGAAVPPLIVTVRTADYAG